MSRSHTVDKSSLNRYLWHDGITVGILPVTKLWLDVLSALQVKPFRKLRKVHNQGKRTRVRDLIRYDLRQMHAAFTGTLPVGSSSEPLGEVQVNELYSHHVLQSEGCEHRQRPHTACCC